MMIVLDFMDVITSVSLIIKAEDIIPIKNGKTDCVKAGSGAVHQNRRLL